MCERYSANFREEARHCGRDKFKPPKAASNISHVIFANPKQALSQWFKQASNLHIRCSITYSSFHP